jgi:hypothetical protein
MTRLRYFAFLVFSVSFRYIFQVCFLHVRVHAIHAIMWHMCEGATVAAIRHGDVLATVQLAAVCVKWSFHDWWQWLAGPSAKCCALCLVWVMFAPMIFRELVLSPPTNYFLATFEFPVAVALTICACRTLHLLDDVKMEAVHIGNCVPV